MKIKEIKVTENGDLEVTFLWTYQEVRNYNGTNLLYFLKPNVNIADLLTRMAEDLEKKEKR